MLPDKIVVVVESIIGKHLRVRLGTNVADLTETVGVHVLAGKPDVGLRKGQRNADFLVAVRSEGSGGIAGVTVIPMHPGEAEPELIDDGW